MGEPSLDKRLSDSIVVRIEKSHTDDFPKEIENYFSYIVSKWKETDEDATKLIDSIRRERLFMIVQERQITGERETISIEAVPKKISEFFADMSADTTEWIEGSVGSYIFQQTVEDDNSESQNDDSTICSDDNREDNNSNPQDDSTIDKNDIETDADANVGRPAIPFRIKGFQYLRNLQPHLTSLVPFNNKRIPRLSPSLLTPENITASDHFVIEEKTTDHKLFIGATFRFNEPSLQLELKVAEISTQKSMKSTSTKKMEVESAEVNAKTVLFQLNTLVWHKNLEKLRKLPDAVYLS